jgi:hypothetical protein
VQKGDIVGTWHGAGQKNFRSDGTLASEKGADAPGYLLYTPEGHVMVLATDPRGVATGDPAKLTVEEKAKAAEGCVAYFGTFELRGDDVLHHIEVALFPGWVGKTRVRHARIEGRRMTFVTDPEADGGYSHIFWERL